MVIPVTILRFVEVIKLLKVDKLNKGVANALAGSMLFVLGKVLSSLSMLLWVCYEYFTFVLVIPYISI